MAHFAQLDENNIVTQVIVVANDDIKDADGNEVEEIGIAFCKNLLGEDTRWVQTSYNHKFRKKYASIGFSYNESLDAFVSPKPYESWIFNEQIIDWQSPLGPAPELSEEDFNGGLVYIWDENLYQSDNTKGWILKTPPPQEQPQQ